MYDFYNMHSQKIESFDRRCTLYSSNFSLQNNHMYLAIPIPNTKKKPINQQTLQIKTLTKKKLKGKPS